MKPVSRAAACEMNTRADADDFIYGESQEVRAGAAGATERDQHQPWHRQG